MKQKPKNPITIVRTGYGDKGYTYLRQDGISKASTLVDFVGDLDEACSTLGYVEPRHTFTSCEIVDTLLSIEDAIFLTKKVLFQIGAMVHSNEVKEDVLNDYCEKITDVIKHTVTFFKDSGIIDELEGFIFPSEENVNEMFSRAVIRRAERSAVKADCLWAVPALNAASDFLFVIAWYNSENIEQWTGFD